MTTTAYPQAVLFDHDGTLVDTEPLWEMGKQRITAAHGGQWTEQDTQDTLGQPLVQTIERLSERGVPGSLEEVYEQFFQVLSEVLTENPPTIIAGMQPLLEDLANRGIPAAIVTNATNQVARYTASLAPEGLIRTIVGDEDVARGVRPKPDPDAYLEATRRLSVDPTQCVAVEDAPAGAQSAVAAGIPVVAVPGIQAVPEHPGVTHVSDHAHVTLDLLRSLLSN